MKASQIILTPRLRLRPPQDGDAQAIFATYANDVEVTRFLSWPRHTSLADTHRFLSFSAGEWQRASAGPYLIELQSDGSLIGSTGLEFESAKDAATGYVLARSAWGQGFATEALNAMVSLAVQLGLRQLHALCHTENLASRRVLEKCGLVMEQALEEGAVFPNLDANRRYETVRYVKNL